MGGWAIPGVEGASHTLWVRVDCVRERGWEGRQSPPPPEQSPCKRHDVVRVGVVSQMLARCRLELPRQQGLLLELPL